MVQPRPLAAALLAALVLAPLVVAPAEAQGARLVPQSLWGVKQSVGLGAFQELVTNHGERSFWQDRPSGQGVRVAIVDTGIDLGHPDLDGVLACDHCWRDLVGGLTTPYDDNGHGTHVAGIVAGRGHLQWNPLQSYFPTGARGVAPGAGLIVAKAMNSTGGGADATVAAAIAWALDPDGDPGTADGAHVVHLSLGVDVPGGPQLPVLRAGSETEDAVRRAIDAGVFVVLSAGNQGQEGVPPPGNVPGVIAVGAVDDGDAILEFSNRGPEVDVFAPGVIMSTWPAALDDDGIRDGYTGLAGTSQAAPVVTGTLALVLGANPALASGGGATKVAHMERLVSETGEALSSGGVGLDAEALLVTQDQGTDGVSWGVVLTLGILALVFAGAVARVALALLRRNAERHANGEKQASDGGPAPVERPAAPREPEGDQGGAEGERSPEP